VEIGTDPVAETLRLAHIDHVSFGVLIEVHAGRGGDGANFLLEIHSGVNLF
jgi:hypothetical protein